MKLGGMNKIYILTEDLKNKGYDTKLLRDLISTVLPNEAASISFKNTNGKQLSKKSESKAELKKQLEIIDTLGGKALIFWDADNNFNETFDYLTRTTKETPHRFFLFPNNSNSGTIETLMDSIKVDHLNFEECWSNMEDCFASKDLPKPPSKGKIYSYQDSYLKEVPHASDTNFLDTDIWNINSDSIKPLRDFLNRELNE